MIPFVKQKKDERNDVDLIAKSHKRGSGRAGCATSPLSLAEEAESLKMDQAKPDTRMSKPAEKKTKILVYGTLRIGQPNHPVIASPTSTFIGEREVNGFTMHTLGPYPFVQQSADPKDTIVCELWEVSPETFQRCDYLEGYNPENEKTCFYDRMMLPEFDGAWIYYQHSGGTVDNYLPTGNWIPKKEEDNKEEK